MKKKRSHGSCGQYCHCIIKVYINYISNDQRLPITILVKNPRNQELGDYSGFVKMIDNNKELMIFKLMNNGKLIIVNLDDIIVVSKLEDYSLLDENNEEHQKIRNSLENHKIQLFKLRDKIKAAGIV